MHSSYPLSASDTSFKIRLSERCVSNVSCGTGQFQRGMDWPSALQYIARFGLAISERTMPVECVTRQMGIVILEPHATEMACLHCWMHSSP